MSPSSTTTLNHVCEFIVDCLHTTAQPLSDGYPLIRTPNVGKGRLDLADVHRVSEETYTTRTKRAVPEPGDLILAREAPAGNVAIVREGEKVCLGQRTVHLRPDRSKIDPDFLCYFMLAPPQQGKLLAGETGATAKHVNMKDIRNLDLAGLPDLAKQRAVGSLLAAYDDLIENNRRRMVLLEDAARQLYREWFVRVRFPGHEHTRITNGVPETWRHVPLFEVAVPTYGHPFQSSLFQEDGDGLPVVRIRDVLAGESRTFTVEDAPMDRRLQNGDMLIGMDGEFHMGLWAGGDAWLNQRVVRIKSNGVIDDYLLFLMLRDPIQQFNDTLTGTTVVHLGAKELKTVRLLLPSHVLLDQANDFLAPVGKQIVALKVQNRVLRTARDFLLPRLMSGELVA